MISVRAPWPPLSLGLLCAGGLVAWAVSAEGLGSGPTGDGAGPFKKDHWRPRRTPALYVLRCRPLIFFLAAALFFHSLSLSLSLSCVLLRPLASSVSLRPPHGVLLMKFLACRAVGAAEQLNPEVAASQLALWHELTHATIRRCTIDPLPR